MVRSSEFQNGCKVEWASEHSYLSVTICEDLKDDQDITRQMQSMYGKRNTSIWTFCMCSDEIKTQLFQSMCICVFEGCYLRGICVYDDTVLFHAPTSLF